MGRGARLVGRDAGRSTQEVHFAHPGPGSPALGGGFSRGGKRGLAAGMGAQGTGEEPTEGEKVRDGDGQIEEQGSGTQWAGKGRGACELLSGYKAGYPTG